jgi:hypothetical protein
MIAVGRRHPVRLLLPGGCTRARGAQALGGVRRALKLTVDRYLLNQQSIQQRSCVLGERAFDDCGQVSLSDICRAENQLA